MKQSILFENGKLYVVELPNYNYGKYSHKETKDFDEATDKAFANKVEVKNPELIARWITSTHMCTLDNKHILDNETFPLPDGIEVEIKKEVCESCPWDLECAKRCPDKIKVAILKRIEPERKKLSEYEKAIEPELPEGLHNGMTAQQVYEWLDKRCMFEPHQKDYVLLIIKLIINAKLST